MKIKRKSTTFLLCLFFGYFGVHRYYVGKIGTGLLYSLTGGVFLAGWIADLISIITNRFTDKFGRPLLIKRKGDALYQQALDIVRSSGQASASYLQRYLLISFSEASALLSRMEEEGAVSRFDGVHPRTVYNIQTDTIEDLDAIDLMEGHDFEYWCADLLKRLGFSDVEVTPGSGDQGVDILAKKEGIKYAIQCKCYASDLGNKPIQEVHAGKAIYNCQVGAVMTNQRFTAGGRQLSEATGVLLWDRDWITRALQSVK